MKIIHVRTHVLEAKLSQPFAYSRAWYASGMAMIVLHRTLVQTGRDYLANSLLSAIAVSDIMSIGRHGWINLGRHEPLGSTTR